ncbi:MAG: hypothetical protein JWN86_843 [Planctomycetota bacterium]|nr:hypothetical protein [Planctomycetota bacterium]
MQTNVIREHIELRPSALHGTKACIAGSRIRVEDIDVWHILQGQSPENFVASFPQLTMADVHAALAYYWDNRETLDRQWEAGERFVEEMKAKAPPSLL